MGGLYVFAGTDTVGRSSLDDDRYRSATFISLALLLPLLKIRQCRWLEYSYVRFEMPDVVAWDMLCATQRCELPAGRNRFELTYSVYIAAAVSLAYATIQWLLDC